MKPTARVNNFLFNTPENENISSLLEGFAFLLIKCEMKFKDDRDLCSRAKV